MFEEDLNQHGYDGLIGRIGAFEGAYVIFKSGDGTFENCASMFGFEKYDNKPCCEKFNTEELMKCCSVCSAGINGYTVYRGIFPIKDTD